MSELYSLIQDSIPLSNDLQFLYPIIFIFFLCFCSIFVFAIFDSIFHIFK